MAVYLDNAASTPMRPEAVEAMLPFLSEHAANPSGSHGASRAAKTALEQAREDVASAMGAAPSEIVFTGSGSESDNLAIKGAAHAALEHDAARNGVVTTGIEHKAVLASVKRLGMEGAQVGIVGAQASGVVDLDALADALDERTAVVSVMLVNNETGIVQPLDDVAALVRERAPHAVLHTDAVQAPQWLDLREACAPADLVSISGHKFGGPKGVGVLLVRGGVRLVPLIEGGGHERELRAGTQNVAGIVALAAALRVTDERRDKETARIRALRDRLERGLNAVISGLAPTSDAERRVPGLLHASIDGVEAETLLVALDQLGVYAASGSACSSGAIDPSHVLLAMGMTRERALSCVRFSFGYASTTDDVEEAVALIPDAVAKLRAAS
jgi:cysteine desulfurase